MKYVELDLPKILNFNSTYGHMQERKLPTVKLMELDFPEIHPMGSRCQPHLLHSHYAVLELNSVSQNVLVYYAPCLSDGSVV